MKKLVLLFIAVLFTAICAKTFAQSTGTTPAPGATHEYSITPGDVSNDITWTVLEDDLSTTATGVTVDDATSATTDITWGSGLTVGDWYYVQVVETDGDGCSNTKVLPVQITASPFYLEILAANASQCYDGAVVVSLADPSTINYDHGDATISFTVTPYQLSSSYSGYTFDVDIDFGTYTGLDASNVSVTSGNGSIAGGTVTVTDNSAVTIAYKVDNTNVFTNSSDVDAQDYTATVTISNGEASNGVGDNGTDGTYVDDTAVSRPNTSGITTN